MDAILTFRRWARLLCITLATLGAVALVLMMLMISFDVLGRDLFNQGILGAVEMAQYLMIPTVFLALGYGQIEDAHINVDVVIQFLSRRKRAVLNIVTLLLTLTVYLPMAWVGYQQAMQIYDLKQVSQVLLIPRWPFQAIVVIGALSFCLAVVSDILVATARAAGREVTLQQGGKVAAD